MLEITEVIYEFRNKEYDTICGVYRVKVNDKPYIFIRNDDSVGAVCHILDKPASQCVGIIRDDVKQEFFKLATKK